MNQDLMGRVFRRGDSEPMEKLPSGHTAWLLAAVENLSATIMESQQQADLPPALEAEEFVYVLEGRLEYEDGRVAETGEAVFNLPGEPRSGKYAGRLLAIRVVPVLDSAPANKELMSKVFRERELQTFFDTRAMTTRRLWTVTENVSIVMNESEQDSVFRDIGHPQKEIIYVIRGHIEYDDGRTIRDGEAVVNLPDRPHPGKRLTKVRSFETKVPAPPDLLAMYRS